MPESSEKPTLTIEYNETTWAPDVAGSLKTNDGETVYSHVSSNRSWVESDLTQNFGRGDALAKRFPDGFVLAWKRTDGPTPAGGSLGLLTLDALLQELAGAPDYAVVVSVWPWPDGGWKAGIVLTDREWAVEQELPDKVLELAEDFTVGWDVSDGFAAGLNTHASTPLDAVRDLWRKVHSE